MLVLPCGTPTWALWDQSVDETTLCNIFEHVCHVEKQYEQTPSHFPTQLVNTACQHDKAV